MTAIGFTIALIAASVFFSCLLLALCSIGGARVRTRREERWEIEREARLAEITSGEPAGDVRTAEYLRERRVR